MLVVPFSPTDSAFTLPFLAVAFALNGVGTASSSVMAITIRQLVTPERLLGRMNASYRFVSYGAIPLGALLGGAAGQALGLRAGLIVGCVALLSAVVWILLSPLPGLRELEDAAAAGACPQALAKHTAASGKDHCPFTALSAPLLL
jgi:predicted MFS family arabinose efflux permease